MLIFNKFNIFDDMNEHFSQIRELEDKYTVQIQLRVIYDKNDWNDEF